MENEEISNVTVKDIKIEELVPNIFDGNIITIFEDHHTVALADGMIGERYSNWLKSKGGIFSRDVLMYTRNKPYGKYVLIEGNGQRTIARLIDDEEQLKFESLRLIDGTIKDKKYMVLKNLQEDESLTSTTRYINNIEEETEEFIETSSILLPRENGGLEDDHNYVTGSVSLFD